jgi:hypothetical protein
MEGFLRMRKTSALGNREHPLKVRHFGQNFVFEPVGKQQGPFLVARRTARTLAAGKRHEIFLPAVLALDAGKAFLDVAALEKLVYRRTNYRPPVSVTPLKTLRVHTLELLKPVMDDLEERRGLVVARAVEFTG